MAKKKISSEESFGKVERQIKKTYFATAPKEASFIEKPIIHGSSWWYSLLRNLLWFLFWLLLILLLLWLLSELFDYLNKNKDTSSTSTGTTIVTEEKQIVYKGIVPESVSKNYVNPVPIGDMDGDGAIEYKVESNKPITETIVKEVIIEVPVPPEIKCDVPYHSNTWFLDQIGYTQQIKDHIAKNKKRKIKVAVLDTGTNHNDLNNSISIKSFNPDGKLDKNGHGTHVAGTAWQVNRDIEIIPIKVSEGVEINTIDYLIGLKHAIDSDVDIINMSFYGMYTLPIEQELIKQAIHKGIILVSASGNSSDDTSNYFPASHSGVLAVGSLGVGNRLSDFSNYGDDVDYWLPGECINSTYLNNSYGKLSGTSMSSPLLAGIISAYLQIHQKEDVTLSSLIKALDESLVCENGIRAINLEKLFGFKDHFPQNDVCLEEEKRKDIIKVQDEIKDYQEEANEFIEGLNDNNLNEKFETLKNNRVHIDNLDQIGNDEIRKQVEEIYSIQDDLFGKTEIKLEVIEQTLNTSFGVNSIIDGVENRFSIIIPKGTKIPAKKSETYLTTKEYQTGMDFTIYKGEKYYASDNISLGRFSIEGLEPIKSIDHTRALVTFEINEYGVLRYTATDFLNPDNQISSSLSTQMDIIKRTKGKPNTDNIKIKVEDLINKIDKVNKEIEANK